MVDVSQEFVSLIVSKEFDPSISTSPFICMSAILHINVKDFRKNSGATLGSTVVSSDTHSTDTATGIA